MDGLRKVATVIVVFAVLFVFRTTWSHSSMLGLISSPLMQAKIYAASYSEGNYSGRHLGLGLISSKDRSVEKSVLQGKAEVQDEKLDESLELLRKASYGNEIANYLDEGQVKIGFGKPKTPGAAAVFVSNFIGSSGSIVISERLEGEPASVIAAILAHEGMHAKVSSALDYDSVQQEYECYVAQAKVWEEARAALTISAGEYETEIAEFNAENEYAVEIMNMNKAEAFKQIRKDYKQIGIDLPLK